MATEKDWIILDRDNDVSEYSIETKAKAYEIASQRVKQEDLHYNSKLRIYELVAVVTPAPQPAHIEVLT